MGGNVSTSSPPSDASPTSNLASLSEEEFKAQVRESADRFKKMVQGNKVFTIHDIILNT